MNHNHTRDAQESRFRRIVEINDTLPWWFFALVVAVGIAVLIYSMV